MKIAFMVLIALFFIIVIGGIILKNYTKKRLDDIDGVKGIYTKLECKGQAIFIDDDGKDSQNEE